MRLFSLLFLAVSGLSSAGCWISSPPTTPFGHQEFDSLDNVADISTITEPPRLVSKRVIVLGRFESQITQPIGSLYDFNDYEISPLYRTYYFKNSELELFEHACDCLRASGLDFRKDYGTTGAPSLVENPLRQQNPLIVRTKILTLQHDQVRTAADPPQDLELAHLVAEVGVYDLLGQQRYQARKEIRGRVPYQDDANLLRLLGLTLGQKLLSDPNFLKAIEASGGAS